jgi:hypothetical protein
MTEDKPDALKQSEEMRRHEEEAVKRSESESGNRLGDDEDQPKPAGPMGGANLGGAS